MKKLLAIVISMAMIVAMMPMGVFATEGEGTEANPYSLEDLGSMTRQQYIEAQNRLGGTMYVDVDDYSYQTNGVLGNGERNDTPGQTPDHSKLNAYGENGYLNEKNDGANGKNIVFVGGTITSGATGYTDIDNIGTSLLLAVPAYTNVTFKNTVFNNVLSFNYQLYTSPWSQLGELKFDGCTFNGIIVGSTAAQTLTFNGCTFENYTNSASANNSNPTWIRPAYGNWTEDDNTGQGSDFRSLTNINFINNTVTSTRPVKFEFIAQWKDTEVTITGNTLNISRQETDGTAYKNMGIYLGAHSSAYSKGKTVTLTWDNNKIGAETAAAICLPTGKTALPTGSKVLDPSDNEILLPAKEWKTANDIAIGNEASVVGKNSYTTLEAAIAAAEAGDTVKLLGNVTVSTKEGQSENTGALEITKNLTIDGNGKTITADTNWEAGKFHIINIKDGAKVTINDLTIVGNEKTKHGINVWTDYTTENATKADVTLNNVTINNCGAAGLVIANSKVKATNLNTAGNAWGAVNVDKGTPTFELVSGNLAEEIKVWSELTGEALNGIKLPANWKVVKEENGKTFYAYVAPVVPVTPSAPATDNVTNNTTDKNTTADLTPAVSDNKSTTTVDNTTADKIVDKAVENKSTEVVIDTAGNNSVASSEVAIPEKTVKEISEKTDANLVIKTDNGQVDLDKAALAAVAEQAGTTGTVTLVVETVKKDENICHVDLKLVTSNGAVKDFKGGNVKVTINLTKELAAKELVCVYIDDNGIYTLVEGVLNADGTYTFTTGHFSEYAVMAKAEADKKIAEQLDTMIKDVNLKVRTSKTAKKNIKAVVSGDVKALTDAGYTVKYKFYRSTKKASKYAVLKTKADNTYINTKGKKGTKYYYKAKALVYQGDKLVGQTVLTQCKYGARTWSK